MNYLPINHTSTSGPTYKGLEVLPKYHLNEQYLESIYNLMNRALAEHPRTMVVRFDLHLPYRVNCPDYPYEYGTDVITKFIESCKAQVRYDLSTKIGRYQNCTVRYVWAKETATANQPHYHVALFLNKDAYFCIGDYRTFTGSNLVSKIYKAWASALGYRDAEEVIHFVHFTRGSPVHYLNRNTEDYTTECNDVFCRLSYLAKFETKQYGDRSKNFMCSRT
ncbi:inovirus Gp2 family protein [Vibrio sp. RC27]